MKKTQSNLILLNMLFAMALVTSNVLAGKVIPLGFQIGDTPVTVTGGIFCYGITFLMTDVISELWGKKEAERSVLFGFIVIAGSSLLILLTRFLPNYSEEAQNAFDMVLGTNWILTIASLCGYICSQNWDVWIFHRIRSAYMKNHRTATAGKWMWNNGSTMTSQAIDTVIFVTIAFGFGQGWLFDPILRRTMFAMAFGQYLIKFLIALCDTPFFYLMTAERRRKNVPGAAETQLSQ